MTIAEQFLDIFEGNGTSWTTPDGEEFSDVIERLGGIYEGEGCSFPDGSVIVTAVGGWDIEGERPFSWRG